MTTTLSAFADLQPDPAWASLPLFDRGGRTRMAFGEFAESIGERAEPKARRGKILFITAANEVTRQRAQSLLSGEHLQHVVRSSIANLCGINSAL